MNKKIKIALSIVVPSIAIGLSSFFVLNKKNSLPINNAENKAKKKVNYLLEKDFFSNVWREQSISTKIKKIDGINKYFTKTKNKEWLWLTTDKNIKGGIKKPSFTNNEIQYKYGDIDIKAKVFLKDKTWNVDETNGVIKYTVTLKMDNLTRDIDVVYWTFKKAKTWLNDLDDIYLKSISSFSDEQIVLGEYISDFGAQYPTIPRKNKNRRIFPTFNHKWLFLDKNENAFPVYFEPIGSEFSTLNSFSIKYKVSLGEYTKEVSLLYSINQTISKPKKFISFTINRPKSSEKIMLNRTFKTKKEIIDYLESNFSARKNEWLDITYSNSKMLFMENIELGDEFRLKFEDRDASFIDWRGVTGMNKFNNPFKGRVEDYSFAFSNLSGIDFSNLKDKGFVLKKPGYYSNNNWNEFFGIDFVYKSELTEV